MEDKKYTPGPWYAINYGGFIELQKQNYHHHECANLLDEEECNAAINNGKLAAAAPDLLNALQELVMAHREDNTKVYGILLERAEAAINKALGK